MTLQKAMESNVRIQPGRKVKTFGGWCRHDRVLLDGHEIGKIQTRRRRDFTEIITVASGTYIMGYDIDWLVEQKKGF